MHWFRTGLQSISGWLVAPPASAARAPAHTREAIRRTMLQALGHEGVGRRPRLAARIGSCRDLETLWALRAELMTAIAQIEGEWHAGQALGRITTLFDGLLPQARHARHPGTRPGMSAWRGH